MAETIEDVRGGRRSAQTAPELQLEVLGGLDTVAEQLDQVVADLRSESTPRARELLTHGERLAVPSQTLHDRVLSRLGDDGATPNDLPLMAALLHVIPSIGRMGDECQILSRLTPRLSHQLSANDSGRVQLSLIGQLARSQLLGAKKALLNRDMNQVDRLVRRDSEIKRAGRKVFERAIDGARRSHGGGSEVIMLIVSHSLEAIADEAMEIGEQAASISAGLFKEFADALAYD